MSGNTTIDILKKELIQMLVAKSFKYSEEPTFKLVSGAMSKYYVNCKPTTLHSRGMYLVGRLFYQYLEDYDIDGVGGLTFGADPIANAVAFTYELHNKELRSFSVRKQQKDHGIVRWVEGDIESGQRLAVVEDVTTTGGSAVKAITRLKEEGFNPALLITLVDRQEGGGENILRHVAEFKAIITRDELMAARAM